MKIEPVVLWFPELNSAQLDRLKRGINQIKIDELELIDPKSNYIKARLETLRDKYKIANKIS